MKIFQIENGMCRWDATSKFPTLKSLTGRFPPSLCFVEAPDFVFEGWGYLDGEFIKPIPPDGWLYDDRTGTFYPEDEVAPSSAPTEEEDTNALLVDHEYRLTLLELGVSKEVN